MSRRLHTPRSVVLLLALVSAVVFGDVSRATCAMHGSGGTGAAMGMSHGKERAPVIAPSGSAPAHQHGGTHRGDRGDPCDCSCIGDCSISAALAILPAVPTLRVATIEAQPRRVLHARTSEAPPASPDRLLPFANGPPDTRLS